MQNKFSLLLGLVLFSSSVLAEPKPTFTQAFQQLEKEFDRASSASNQSKYQLRLKQNPSQTEKLDSLKLECELIKIKFKSLDLIDKNFEDFKIQINEPSLSRDKLDVKYTRTQNELDQLNQDLKETTFKCAL